MGDSKLPLLDPPPGRAPAGFFAGLVLNGRYRLESLLGEGGMGTVWVGSQLALQRRVAVKSLRVGASTHRARLKREALALAAVHHPSIVEVYDYGETEGGVPYVVMELVRGESLAARLDREGTLPAEEAVRLSLSILDGLVAAHQAGVIHRDIKPDNVVLAEGRSGLRPVLLDFGIARLDSDADARLTLDGSFIGTPAYMAPEQMRGGPTDERVDVWGVGALLYHLLAGEPPFGTREVIAVMRKVLEDPPSFPRRARARRAALEHPHRGAAEVARRAHALGARAARRPRDLARRAKNYLRARVRAGVDAGFGARRVARAHAARGAGVRGRAKLARRSAAVVRRTHSR